MFKSVAIIQVSSEYLSGKNTTGVQDFLISQLSILNFEIQRLLVIKESEHELSQEILNLSKKCDFLIVVGKLNNDVIFKTLGNTFCDEVKINKVLKGKSTNDDLAMLPSSAKLITSDNLPYPVIHLRRIFLLKEEFVEIQFFDALRSHLEYCATKQTFTKIFQVQMNGNSRKITDKLSELVNIQFQDQNYLSIVTVSSQSFENIVECESILRKELKENVIECSESKDLLERIYQTNDELTLGSLKVIEECFTTYGPDNIFLSFNGGKDCTVLLHLVHTVLRVKYPEYRKPILCLYVKSPEAFTEQDNFISQCEIFYNLNIMVVTSSIKEALYNVLSRNKNLKACFMGTRRTDPYSQNLSAFQMTDRDWPQVMRVSPLLEWHYSDIWDYLLFFKVPYCKLYDMGYTSIGSSSNTIRNPSLLYHDVKEGREIYLPAYKLLNESDERSGRNIGF